MPQPSLAADNNSCPWCLARLAIQWCKSGPNKEKAFLVCDDIDLHPQRQPFWHWWGVVASRQARALLSATPSPTLPDTPSFSVASSSASTVPLPSSSTFPVTQAISVRCRYGGGCNSSRVAPGCKSKLCKQHCIMRNNGSCPVKTHDPATMSQQQRRAANVPPPVHRRRALLSPPPAASRAQSPIDGFTPAFLDGLDDIARSQSFAWDYGPALQQARINSPSVYLDQALRTGQRPPSPPSLPSFQDPADYEDEDLQHALTLSLAPPPPSQPRVPASSIVRKTTLPKPPRITTQLNPAWMSQAAGTRPANDTFAVRQPSARRAPVDLTTIQRFTLVYWDKDDKPPLILGVTECPSWPEFRLSQSTRTLDLLDKNLDAVEYYNVRFCLWTRVEICFTHILTTDTYLLLRRVGVSGADEDRFIDHFVHLPGPQHIRYNVTAEREAVRRKLKARQTRTDGVQIVKVNGVKLESPIHIESPVCIESPVRVARPSLHIVTSPICLDDNDTTPPSTASSALFSASSLILTPCTTPPASPFVWPASDSDAVRPSATPSATPKWPSDMYTVDMAQGFLEMEAANVQHIPQAQRFQLIFKSTAEFRLRTYTDARLRWTRGSESLRKAALDAGRTKAGLWSAYAAQVPLKK